MKADIKTIADRIEDIILHNVNGIDEFDDTMIALTKELRKRYESGKKRSIEDRLTSQLKNRKL